MATKLRIRPLCPSCGNILADKQVEYENLLNSGMSRGEAMDTLGVKNVCCRTRFMAPAIEPLGSYFHRVKEDSLNINLDYTMPTGHALLSLVNRDGTDFLIQVVKPRPVSMSTTYIRPAHITSRATEQYEDDSKISELDKTDHSSEHRQVFFDMRNSLRI